MKKNIILYSSILFPLILTTLLLLGISSKAKIGVITNGPTIDIWAITIAISKLEHNLNGGVGYLKIDQELAKYLTSSGNDITIDYDVTKKILNDPTNLAKALGSASKIPLDAADKDLNNLSNLITMYAEDIGIAYFYTLAFKLFGYHPDSTHVLYFFLLFISIALYVMEYKYNGKALLFLNLYIVSLFMLSQSIFFNDLVPNFAANRFLSTLGFIPLLHYCSWLLCKNEKSAINFYSFLGLFFQALILGAVCLFRSSANWMILAIISVTICVFVLSKMNYKKTIIPFGIFILSVLFIKFISTMTLDKIYSGEDVIAHHMFWHAAMVGLSHHPDWEYYAPYEFLKKAIGDQVAFHIYDYKMKTNPKKYSLSKIRSFYKIGLHEKLIKKEFIKFIKNHPKYTYELYTYYKPIFTYVYIKNLLLKETDLNYFDKMILIISFFLMISLLFLDPPNLWFAGVFFLISGCSFIPLEWAYPDLPVMADQMINTYILILFTSTAIVYLLVQLGLFLLRSKTLRSS